MARGQKYCYDAYHQVAVLHSLATPILYQKMWGLGRNTNRDICWVLLVSEEVGLSLHWLPGSESVLGLELQSGNWDVDLDMTVLKKRNVLDAVRLLFTGKNKMPYSNVIEISFTWLSGTESVALLLVPESGKIQADVVWIKCLWSVISPQKLL